MTTTQSFRVDMFTPSPLGWVGGNPPAWFDTCTDLLLGDEATYGFLFTFALDDHDAISVFLAQDFNYRIEHNIYPGNGGKVFRHPITEQSKRTDSQLLADDGTSPVLRQAWLHPIQTDAEHPPILTVGGEPTLIQEEDCYTCPLESDGWEFFACFDEDGYCDEQLLDQYPLTYGALYVYRRGEDFTFGFWQYS